MSGLMPYRYRSHRTDHPLSLLSDDFFRPFFLDGEAPAAFRVDVRDEGKNYVMEAELPGTKRENIHIDVDEGLLTISAEWENANKQTPNGDFVLNERRAGRVQRSFSLENVAEDQITATAY